MRKLSVYQKRKLLENPNIEKITEKNVTFTSKFKIKAVEQYYKGLNPDQIFTDAGINLKIFLPNTQNPVSRDGKKNTNYTEEIL